MQFEEILKEEREEGRKDFASLVRKLLAEGRLEDLKRASEAIEYRDALIAAGEAEEELKESS